MQCYYSKVLVYAVFGSWIKALFIRLVKSCLNSSKICKNPSKISVPQKMSHGLSSCLWAANKQSPQADGLMSSFFLTQLEFYNLLFFLSFCLCVWSFRVTFLLKNSSQKIASNLTKGLEHHNLCHNFWEKSSQYFR